jgi:hypothetical protein
MNDYDCMLKNIFLKYFFKKIKFLKNKLFFYIWQYHKNKLETFSNIYLYH